MYGTMNIKFRLMVVAMSMITAQITEQLEAYRHGRFTGRSYVTCTEYMTQKLYA
jgi:hypothetical protein